MQLHNVAVRSVGAYLPGEEISIDEIDDYLGVILGINSAKYYRLIERFAGVGQRYYAIEKHSGGLLEDSAEMSAKAAALALERAGILGSDIDLIVTTTTTPPFLRGGLAKEIRLQIGNPGCTTFDLWGACTGIQQAITLATACIRAGLHSNALLVGVELASTTGRAENYAIEKVDRHDMLLRGALGDGAGALILSRAEYDTADQVLFTGNGTEGSSESQFHRGTGGSTEPFNAATFEQGGHHWRHDFQKMVAFGIPYFVAIVRRVLNDLGLSLEDIDFVVPAAANFKYATRDASALGLNADDRALAAEIRQKMVTNFAKVGNVPSAAIYIALNELFEKRLLQPGALLLLASVEGATWGWGASMLRWGGR